MVDQLFGSKTRVKLLQLFYRNPNRSFYVREITRKIDEQINSVRRELSNLLSIGIISSETNNNRLYYEVNQTFEYFNPLSQIFGGKSKATSSAKDSTDNDDIQSLILLGNVDLVIYSGQFTRDETSGIDILFVGDINKTQLNRYIDELEAKESKELRYTVMTQQEFNYRQQVNDRFLTLLLASKNQVVYDKNNKIAATKLTKSEDSKQER